MTALATTASSGGVSPTQATSRRSLWFVFAVVLLIWSSAAFFPLIRPNAHDIGAGDPMLRIMWLPFYAGSVAGLLRAERRAWRIDPVLASFLGLAFASVFWSQDPALTIRRSVALAATVFCGAFLASRMTFKQLGEAVFLAAVVVAASSLLYWLLAGPDALDPVSSTLRGVYTQKNELGRMMALGLVSASLLFTGDTIWRPRQLAGPALLLLVLLLSNSQTSLIVTLVITSLVLFHKAASSVRWSALAWAGGFFAAAATSLLLVKVGGPLGLIDLLGRNATLSGRAQLWDAVTAAIRKRPGVGYGFGAFWRGNPESTIIRSRAGFATPHAHDGFLDLALQLGLVGVGVGSVVLLRVGVIGARRLSATRFDGRFIVAITLFAVLANVTESNLLRENSIVTVLITTCALSALPKVDTAGHLTSHAHR